MRRRRPPEPLPPPPADPRRETAWAPALLCLLFVPALAAAGCRDADSRPAQAPPSATSEDAGSARRAALPSLAELPRFETDLSVDQAYAAIPHRRTPFDFAASSLAADEAAYLRSVFHLIDQATRLRVTAYRDLHGHGATSKQELRQLDELGAVLAAIDPPPRLREYHRLVLAALADQRAFLSEWEAAGPTFAYRGRIGAHPRVTAASAALRRAYDELMKLYGPAEPARNRAAFFDYHCALDFL